MSVVLLLAVLSAAWGQEGSIQLILNDPTSRLAPTNQCDTEVCTSLVSRIEAAELTIDFALYGMRNQTRIFQALLAAQQRGVTVRGIVDMDVENKNYYSSTEELMRSLGTLRTDHTADLDRLATVEDYEPDEFQCESPEGFAGPVQCLAYDVGDRCFLQNAASREKITFKGDIMHNKFMIVDRRWTWTGSTNASDSGTGGYNANLVTLIDSPTVAGWYTKEFDQMYLNGRYHRQKYSHGPLRALVDDVGVEVLFSPQDKPITRAVLPLIKKAKKRIDIMVFFLTHKEITRELVRAHQRGVQVRVILDATAAKNGYTKHPVLRAAGIKVKIEDWGGKMHMKSASVDSRWLVTGSMNWTSAGEGGNDENTVILDSPRLAHQYEQMFDRLFTSIDERWLEGRPDPESFDSGTACTDGVDNDYDKLPDDQDPSCSDNPPELPALPPWRLVEKAPGHGLVKGVHTADGKPVFDAPGGRYYERMTVDPDAGEQFFCSISDALESGYSRYREPTAPGGR